jgi:hypothetical protein
MSFWTRRIIYLIFAIALAIPLITHWSVPPDVGPEAQQLYDAIERVPSNKIVLIGLQFEAGSLAENGPQTQAIVTHLMKRGKRFALMGWDPIGPGLGEDIAEKLAAKYHRPYGETWVNWGYKLGTAPIVKGMARDIPGTIGKDIKGKDVATYPAMNGIKTARDIGLVIDISPSATYPLWISYFTQPNHVPFAVAPTSVMISDIYPFMNSGQVVGMLKGIAGAAQYEKLIREPGEGYVSRMPVFMAHVTIIALVLFGNIDEIRRRRQGESE